MGRKVILVRFSALFLNTVHYQQATIEASQNASRRDKTYMLIAVR
jgi:hypothetical protein